ncbi:MAG: aldo/keto reductase [Thermoguttaceae bacterium]|nr:aldo/keto reductase [Thermoguttaceae bacterium]
MQFRKIGKTDIEASAIAMGCWVIGGWMWGGADENEAIRAIQTSLDEGITMIDTAPIYGLGRSETIVGKAIKGRKRDNIVIASKCAIVWSTEIWEQGKGELHSYIDDHGFTQDFRQYAMYRYMNPKSMKEEIDKSLKRLGTDYIDVMQIHHCMDRTTPIADAMGALEELRTAGKIRAIGISNATPEQFQEFCKAGSLDVDQERYSLIDRTVEKNGRLAGCDKNEVSFFAYSPLESGLLTGRIDPDRPYADGDHRKGNPNFAPDFVRKINKKLEDFADIGRKYDLNTAQLMIAWILARYRKLHALCGARNATQAANNAKAGHVVLDSDDVKAIDEMSAMLR